MAHTLTVRKFSHAIRTHKGVEEENMSPLLANAGICRKGGRLKGNVGVSKGTWASQREHGHLKGNVGVSKGTWASRRERGRLEGNVGISKGTWAS